MTDKNIHPPGRRRMRSPLRPDGYEVWSMDLEKYHALRDLILTETQRLDEGKGVFLQDLVLLAERQLTGHPKFENGRFTHWLRFVKVDLEVEGLLERVPNSTPQRIKLIG